MRYELHNRDGKLLGRVDLRVPPVELMQCLVHAAVVLGPAVDEVLAPSLDITPVALAAGAGATLKTKRRSKKQ